MAKKHYEWAIGEEPPELGEHSLAKHRILEKYVRRYVEICTATPVQEKLNLTIVDGYCGGGRYIFNGEDVLGSPLILLNAIAEMQDKLNAVRPKGFEIRTNFLFVDVNGRHTDYLRSEIVSSPFYAELDKSIQIWTSDFNVRVDDAIALAKKHSPQRGRSLFILDQYGWSQVAFGSIRKILGNLEKAEVFLTFSVDSLIDYMSECRLDDRAYHNIDADSEVFRDALKVKQENAAFLGLSITFSFPMAASLTADVILVLTTRWGSRRLRSCTQRFEALASATLVFSRLRACCTISAMALFPIL